MLESKEKLWITFSLKDNIYALSSDLITSISVLPSEITTVPETSSFIRGITRYRDEVMALVNLRELFNLPSIKTEQEEFQDMLEKVKKQYLDWINILKRCIKNDEELNLEIDPHKCEFGKWYYSYKSNVLSIDIHLKKIEEYHKKIHDLAKKVNNVLINQEKNSQKDNLFEKLEIEISEITPQIIKLIDQAKSIFEAEHKEMMLVIEYNNYRIGIIVDKILHVQNNESIIIAEETQQVAPPPFIKCLARTVPDETIIILLDIDEIVKTVNEAIDK